MLTVHIAIALLSMVACFIFGILYLIDGDDEYPFLGNICLVSFIVFVISIGFLIVGTEKCENSEWVVNETPYKVETIVSLNDNNLTNGEFYLRSGYINEDLYYQYVVQLDNGGFKTNKVKSANATLFYDTGNYRVEWYTKTKNWLYFEQEEIYNKIYIPEGSISNSYTIDLN